MIGFPDPQDMRSPQVAREHYVIARVMVIGYLLIAAMVAAGYALIPSPVWGIPMGIALISGARASRWCMAYRRHIRTSRGIEA